METTPSTELVRFQSDGNRLLGRVVYPKDQKPGPGVLFLHGGGEKTGKDTFDEWQEYLGRRGIASFAFDFRGAPKAISDPALKSEGDFTDSTLNNRLMDAENAMYYFLGLGVINADRLALAGVSMGGHIASRLAGKYPDIFKLLILKSPAAYVPEAEDKRHDGSFTKVIRSSEDWESSLAFKGLENYRNPRYLFYGQEDRVIPEGVRRGYMKRLQLSHNGFMVNMPHVGHLALGSNEHYELNARAGFFWDTWIWINAVNSFRIKERLKKEEIWEP